MLKNNSPFSILNSQLTIIFAVILISCSDYDREEFRMEVGKKYALKQFPDSLYVDTLDRFFKKEPIKQSAKQKAEITMQADFSSKIEKPKKEEKNAPPPPHRESSPKKEEKPFADAFFYSLLKLSENPESREYGRNYSAKSGEDIDELLVRIYGTKINTVPKNMTKNILKNLNPNSDFNSLGEGEAILLPVVK